MISILASLFLEHMHCIVSFQIALDTENIMFWDTEQTRLRAHTQSLKEALDPDTVTHPSTNRVRRKLTSLIETTDIERTGNPCAVTLSWHPGLIYHGEMFRWIFRGCMGLCSGRVLHGRGKFSQEMSGRNVWGSSGVRVRITSSTDYATRFHCSGCDLDHWG